MMMTTAYQVTYSSPSDSFTTIQLSQPRDRKYYTVAESKPVVLHTLHPNELDSSSLVEPFVRTVKGRRVPLTKAIEQGLVKVREAGVKTDQGEVVVNATLVGTVSAVPTRGVIPYFPAGGGS